MALGRECAQLLLDLRFLRIMRKKNRLSQGIRKYIRRQKMIIQKLAKDKTEEDRLIRELLDRFYIGGK